MIKPIIFVSLILFVSLPSQAQWPKANAVPGGVAIVPLNIDSEHKPTVTLGNKPVWVRTGENGWEAVVGVGLKSKPGNKKLTVKKAKPKRFKVADKEYEAQYITIKNKRHVNPNKLDMTRINSEKARKAKARNHWSEPKNNPELPFIQPVAGRYSSPFGLKRFFNKQPRNPHSGLDIAAPRGTPIQAPAGGTVIEVGDFFFSGNVVYVDHGHGLITLYAHLNETKVNVGDQLKAGDLIGTVGDTGRVTGPHLHWTVYLNGTPVEPKLFFTADDA